MKIAVKFISKMFKCSHCDKVYKYESERKRHQKSHFPQFDCKVCFKKFSFLSALRRHQKQHERTGSVQCSECKGNFRDVILLKRHIQYSHNGSYCCSECKTVFRSDLALRTHSRIHLPEAERRFRCTREGCTKTFNFAHHLRHHQLTHSNTKQHFCNICGKGFIQAHHLKTHLYLHSIENCLSCTTLNGDKQFDSINARHKHIGTHRKLLDDNLTDTILCTVCGGLIAQQQYNYHKRQCSSFMKLSRSNDTFQELLKNNDAIKATTPATSTHGMLQLEINPVNTELKGNDTSKSNFSEVFSSTSIDDKSHTPVTEFLFPTFDTNNNSDEKNGCSSCSYDNKQALCGTANSNNTFSLELKPLNVYKVKCMPEIEYRDNGILKIRKTFDADILTINEAHRENNGSKNETNNLKYVPFNSCKAVLGNCIVSEDGSIGEGCLCAKMIVDEQQMSAQEIDELTPNRNLVLFS